MPGEIALKYEIERFVRPAEIVRPFRTVAPNAPNNLATHQDWLEDVSGVEWDVQSNDGGPESVSENAGVCGRKNARPRPHCRRSPRRARFPRLESAAGG
jgi:hypothetical protein